MEDFDIPSNWESSEVSGSPEVIREKSEKQKESYKKAQAQIQKSQKDEKKAKWDNDELFDILTRFIQNPYYESLIPSFTDLLIIALPSRPIIGILALVYPDAAHHVLQIINQWERINTLKSLHRYHEPWIFHEKSLHESIRQWINIWIDSFDKYIVDSWWSLIMQKKFLNMIIEKEDIIITSITEFVWFFFGSRNVIISKSTTESYTRFILNNFRKTLENSLDKHPDREILQEEKTDDSALFWL